jgi:hypothetical protein
MPEPVLSPNLAKKAKFRNWFKKEIAGHIKAVRDDRNAVLRPQWLRYRRMWTLRGTEQSYHGRLKLYIPTAHRIAENWEQKLKNDLFPQSGKWFKCKADSTVDEEKAQEIQTMMGKALMGKMAIKHKFPPLLRNLLVVGTSPVEIGWLHKERAIPTLQTIMEQGKPVTQEVMRSVVQYLGPTFRNIDPFLFYVYPSTVQFVHEASLVFEDMMVDYATIKRQSQTPIDPTDEDLGNQVENFAAVKEYYKSRNDSDKFQAEQIRLAERGLKSRSEKGKEDPNRPMDLTVGYWQGTLLEEEDEEGESVPEPPTWYKFMLCGDDILVSLRQNPWWDQEPSYLCAKFSELHNEFWGYGLMFLLDHLQYFQNDIWNQTGDGLVFSLNPIVAMDSTAIQYPDSIRYSPGARWLMRDPTNSVFMMEPPKDTAMMGMQAIQSISAYMNDVSNVSPSSALNLAAPSPTRATKGAGTATGMSIISQDALLQVREVEEAIEGGILTPMLGKMYSRYQQCLDTDLLLRMEGADGASIIETTVNRDSLVGSFQFEWLGSVFTFNQNVKTQHMLNFIQIISRLPPEALAQDNARIDWKYLLRTVWATGFGDREAALVVKDIEPTRTIDAYVENELFVLGRGKEVTVSPNDNDEEHLQMHDVILQDPRLDLAIRNEMMEHMKRHAASMQMKQQQAMQQQAMQALQPLLAAAQGGAPGGPQQGNGANPPPQNPGRLPNVTTDADVQRTMPRQEGPPQ